ncbi:MULTISPECIES: NUDIX hydrolase [Heyndrickxia]|jgi:mutator protein MutT|uniref:NUDIX hydrolase n=3 Tax=Heyndrickxia TaxID=2837504 RepID=G2THF3_HEYCO|nr:MULTISPECIES: NUDIX hydrolase [Heyndrickxia]AEP00292.1 NUDIX hydrolase [Heyndrickxia coagulans 36D1]AVD54877.1 NUDIX hydrolase [Heyndrickxia coagulans]KGT37270.1 NUDIX hydrolase [Heyndrickxia coagulans P38]KWZ81366.1 hydrolase, NUDIX family [Heyndrickxia coagulans]MBQ4912281.1 NUDIX hydrolase [Heyndrickxia faecalis]
MSFVLPVSVKGIIIHNGHVLLLKNERNEWELPGGRLEKNESPETCVKREIKEELNLKCSVENIIDSWVYEVLPNKFVFIVTYFCVCDNLSHIQISEEHIEYKWIKINHLENELIPEGYRHSITAAAKLVYEKKG